MAGRNDTEVKEREILAGRTDMTLEIAEGHTERKSMKKRDVTTQSDGSLLSGSVPAPLHYS